MMIRNVLAAAALAALAFTTAACNTVQGVGEDIKSVGRAGERAID
jgi:entericidin B